jgi:hypothetical protein
MHFLRWTKASIIYKQTGNLRALQIQQALDRADLVLLVSNTAVPSTRSLSMTDFDEVGRLRGPKR